jgi:hypothetical protein
MHSQIDQRQIELVVAYEVPLLLPYICHTTHACSADPDPQLSYSTIVKLMAEQECVGDPLACEQLERLMQLYKEDRRASDVSVSSPWELQQDQVRVCVRTCVCGGWGGMWLWVWVFGCVCGGGGARACALDCTLDYVRACVRVH